MLAGSWVVRLLIPLLRKHRLILILVLLHYLQYVPECALDFRAAVHASSHVQLFTRHRPSTHVVMEPAC